MGDLLRARAKFLPQLAEYISQGELVDVSVSHSENFHHVLIMSYRESHAFHCISIAMLVYWCFLDGNPRSHQMKGYHSVDIVDLSSVEGRVDWMGRVWEGHLTRNIVEEWYRMNHVFFDSSASPLMLGAWWCGCLCVEGWDFRGCKNDKPRNVFPASCRTHSTRPSQEFPAATFHHDNVNTSQK